ncbi:excisionase [Salmonella enterica]
MLHPPPEKYGRAYLFEETAIRLKSHNQTASGITSNSLCRRIINGRKEKK